MAETSAVQGTVTKLSKEVSKNDKIFYKLGIKDFEQTIFVWNRKLIDEPGIQKDMDILVEFEPGDYPEAKKITKLSGNVQATVGGKQQHTDKQVRDFSSYRTPEQIVRCEAIQTAAKFVASFWNSKTHGTADLFSLAQDIEAWILTGKKPETKSKVDEAYESTKDSGKE